MSQPVQVATLQERVRVLCGLGPFSSSSAPVTSAGILDLLRTSLVELGSIVNEHAGANLLTSYGVLTTVPGLPVVSLPTNCSDIVRLTWLRAIGDESPPLAWANLEEWEPSSGGWDGYVLPKYRAMGANTLELFPTPQAAHTLRVYYTTGIYITSTSDFVVMRDGWDQWAVFNTCVMVRMAQQKTNEDVSPASFIAQRDVVEARIRKQLRRERDHNGVQTLRDERSASFYPFDDEHWRRP